jgi:hypothetical protein
MRILSAQVVKTEGCQKAHDALRDAFRDLSQRVELGRSQSWNRVQASTDAGQLPCPREAADVFWMDSCGSRLREAKHSNFSSKLYGGELLSGGHV